MAHALCIQGGDDLQSNSMLWRGYRETFEGFSLLLAALLAGSSLLLFCPEGGEGFILGEMFAALLVLVLFLSVLLLALPFAGDSWKRRGGLCLVVGTDECVVEERSGKDPLVHTTGETLSFSWREVERFRVRSLPCDWKSKAFEIGPVALTWSFAGVFDSGKMTNAAKQAMLLSPDPSDGMEWFKLHVLSPAMQSMLGDLGRLDVGELRRIFPSKEGCASALRSEIERHELFPGVITHLSILEISFTPRIWAE